MHPLLSRAHHCTAALDPLHSAWHWRTHLAHTPAVKQWYNRSTTIGALVARCRSAAGAVQAATACAHHSGGAEHPPGYDAQLGRQKHAARRHPSPAELAAHHGRAIGAVVALHAAASAGDRAAADLLEAPVPVSVRRRTSGLGKALEAQRPSSTWLEISSKRLPAGLHLLCGSSPRTCGGFEIRDSY